VLEGEGQLGLVRLSLLGCRGRGRTRCEELKAGVDGCVPVGALDGGAKRALEDRVEDVAPAVSAVRLGDAVVEPARVGESVSSWTSNGEREKRGRSTHLSAMSNLPASRCASAISFATQ